MASSTSTCSVCGEGGITLSNSLMHSLACERRRREKKRKRSREEEEEPAAEKEEEMVVISWNTGGTDEPAPLARAEAIASILLQRKPHVVCLQEVTQESGPIFVRRLGGIGGYAVSPADVACRSSPFPDASYFTMTFSRKDVCTALVARRVPFPSSCMGRDVLVSGMRFAAKDVRVLNTHLESGAASSAVRCSQLSTFLDLLGGCSEEEGGEALLGIACGDLNVREAEVGNEKKVGQFQDAWEAVHGARDR
jgi:endonuclease/exonuclease/phosphatase family metal-dependent hydrolase